MITEHGMKNTSQNRCSKGYTLIETLVASAVMMVAIGAASSLSLSMVSQEEMSERTVRVMNHLENAAALYQLGFDTADIGGLLTNDPAVSNLSYASETPTVSGLGTIDVTQITVQFKPSAATSANSASEKSWTGGDSSKVRSHSVKVFRSNP